LSISNTGGGTLSWEVSDNAAWLTLSPASGTGNGAVMLSVATGTLTAGSYNGTVTISATGASPVIVPIVLTVARAPVTPPAIGASPVSFFFTATEGSANPATQTLSISNTGGGTLSWEVSDNAAWLTLSPASGTGNGAVMLSVATGTLTAGSYNGTVTISATGASPVTVPVVFDVSTFRSGKKTSPSTPHGLRLSLGKIK
jgi:BACON domain-containing protein